MLKIASCPARLTLAGSRPRQSHPTGSPHPGPGPRPTPETETEAAGTAWSPQVPRRVEGPRAEERPRPSGMGARGAASRALAWASLPLLGLPAGALCEDTLYCRGKAGPQPARLSLFPGTCWRLFLLPHPGSVAGGRGRRKVNAGFGTQAGLGEESQAPSASSSLVRKKSQSRHLV